MSLQLCEAFDFVSVLDTVEIVLRVRQHFETPYRSVDPYERVTYSLAMQFVQFVVLTERSALWARPRDDASSVVGLDMSHAFCIDFFHASALI